MTPPMNMTRAFVFDALKNERIKVLIAYVEMSYKWFKVVFLICFVH